jgi:hypothetical protein
LVTSTAVPEPATPAGTVPVTFPPLVSDASLFDEFPRK